MPASVSTYQRSTAASRRAERRGQPIRFAHVSTEMVRDKDGKITGAEHITYNAGRSKRKQALRELKRVAKQIRRNPPCPSQT